jgi:hypothetical protein
MQLIAGSVTFQFLQPPIAPVRGRGAILATAVPMPETAVDEDRRFVFGQKNVRAHKTRLTKCGIRSSECGGAGAFYRFIPHFAFRTPRFDGDPDVQAEAVAQPVEQGTDNFFRRRVLAADAAHVPGTAGFGQTIPIHERILTAKEHRENDFDPLIFTYQR